MDFFFKTINEYVKLSSKNSASHKVKLSKFLHYHILEQTCEILSQLTQRIKISGEVMLAWKKKFNTQMWNKSSYLQSCE